MNSKNNKGIFYGLLSVMVFGVLSLRAAAQSNPEMALFRRAIGTWSAGKRVSDADRRGSSYVAPDFASVVTAFKAISFKNVEQAQEFAQTMSKVYALTEAEKTQLMDANESFKALIAQPEVQAALAKGNPSFWNSWLGLLGKIIQAVGNAASAGASAVGSAGSVAVSAVGNAASAGASAVSNAASAGASAVADRVYGRTKVLNLSTGKPMDILNPGIVLDGAEVTAYLKTIAGTDSLDALSYALRYLESSNSPSKFVTRLSQAYQQKSKEVSDKSKLMESAPSKF